MEYRESLRKPVGYFIEIKRSLVGNVPEINGAPLNGAPKETYGGAGAIGAPAPIRL